MLFDTQGLVAADVTLPFYLMVDIERAAIAYEFEPQRKVARH